MTDDPIAAARRDLPPGGRKLSDSEARDLLVSRMVFAGLSQGNAEWVVAGWPWWKVPETMAWPEPGPHVANLLAVIEDRDQEIERLRAALSRVFRESELSPEPPLVVREIVREVARAALAPQEQSE